MNIRSAGPALHLAPKATNTRWPAGFVAVREHEREIFIKHVDGTGRTKSTGSVDAAQISRARYYVATGRDAS